MHYIDLKNYLSNEYLETFNQIQNNLTLSSGIDIQMEEKLEKLVVSFIEAQKNNEPVSNIIGDDLDLFMKKLTANINKKSKILKN